MKLKISGMTVETSIAAILTRLQVETGNPKDIWDKGHDVLVSCPFHKDGNEAKPSCSVIQDTSGEEEAGTFHCWACQESGTFPKLVAKVRGGSIDSAKNWIVGNTSVTCDDYLYIADKVDLNANKTKEINLDRFEPLNEHCYNYLLGERKLNKQVVDYFGLVYDRENDAVVFPVKDVTGKVITTTQRCIGEKKFYNMKENQKPVYLLYEAMKYPTVYVCESQVNALTLWGWGYPAIALLGTGADTQYDIIKKCGITTFVLCFDGDGAGKNGDKKFRKNIRNSILLSKLIPKGKDVNDLTKEEFEGLLCE